MERTSLDFNVREELRNHGSGYYHVDITDGFSFTNPVRVQINGQSILCPRKCCEGDNTSGDIRRFQALYIGETALVDEGVLLEYPQGPTAWLIPYEAIDRLEKFGDENYLKK